MANPYSKSVSFTDYAAESEDIARRRKLAEMMQAQAFEPIPQQSAGGYVVPISWTQMLAKVLQGGVGAYEERKLKDEAKQLSQTARDENRSWLERLQGTPGTPGVPEQNVAAMPADYEDNPNLMSDSINIPAQPGMPAKPLSDQERMSMIMAGASSGNPLTAPMAGSMLSKMLEPEKYGHDIKFTADGRGYMVGDRGSIRWQDQITPRDKLEPVTTAGANGAPQTEFINPYQQRGPMPQPVRNEMLNLGNLVQPTNPYTQNAPLSMGVSPNTVFSQAREDARYDRVSANTAAGNAVTMRGQNMSNDPNLQGRIAQATASGREIGQGVAQAQLALPDAAAKAEQAVNLVDQMIGTEGLRLGPSDKRVAPHPGFNQVIGATITPGMRFVHGTDAASFDALLEQVKGGAFLQAFEALKGGGAISEIEGTKATAAITRMGRAQTEQEFVKAAREFQEIARNAVNRMRQKAGSPRVIDFGSLPNGR